MNKTAELAKARAERKRRYIPAAEVARQRKVTRETVYHWCKRGLLPVERVPRGKRSGFLILRREYERRFPRRPSVYDEAIL